MSLDQRMFRCETRGLGIHRDVNAAINLARLDLAGTHSVTGRGGKVRLSQQNLAGVAHPGDASTDAPPEVGAPEILRLRDQVRHVFIALDHQHSLPKERGSMMISIGK